MKPLAAAVPGQGSSTILTDGMMAGDVASTMLSRMATQSVLSLEQTPACGCVAAATALAGKHDHSCA